MNLTIIFGTRPEYLKLIPIIDECKGRDIRCNVIYVQQHQNIDEQIDISYERLRIDNEPTDRLCSLGKQILDKLPNFIQESTYIMVQGDTATAYYSTLVAFNLQKKIIHIEAGLRTYDLTRPFPEEAYRQMISRMASIHFTPHIDSNVLLVNECVSGEIYNVGNTILDLIHSYKLTCSTSNIVMITFHRRENWDKIELLLSGLKKLVEKTPHIKYIWYLHHNPELQNQVKKAIKDISSVELCSPSNHKKFTYQMSQCNFLITDSGGIQEEASFLGKHSIVLRASTERNHIPPEYITILEDYSKLDEVYEKIPKELLEPCNVYGYGNSSKQIIKILHP